MDNWYKVQLESDSAPSLINLDLYHTIEIVRSNLHDSSSTKYRVRAMGEIYDANLTKDLDIADATIFLEKLLEELKQR